MDLRLNMDEYLPLREVVFKTLRNAIVHGEFEPGERLMEVTLAKRLGVSRTPVREAMRRACGHDPEKGSRGCQDNGKGSERCARDQDGA